MDVKIGPTLREEFRLKILENRALRRMYLCSLAGDDLLLRDFGPYGIIAKATCFLT
jgi:hypothetical protein